MCAAIDPEVWEQTVEEVLDEIENMNIGETEEVIVVEPIPEQVPLPLKEPAPEPERVPEKVPA